MDRGIALALVVSGGCLALLPWLDRNSPRVRLGLLLVSGFFTCRYLCWRFTGVSHLRFDAGGVCAFSFLAFEAWALTHLLRRMSGRIRTRDRRSDADRHMDWYAGQERWPVIDFFIPTYNEEMDLIERAAFSALAQDYSHVRVWILDDGRRAWVREFAERTNVGYITRHDNAHHKAGNLNNALLHVMGLPEKPDFVAVLDCDFVAVPSCVRRLLSLMHDPRVGVVQPAQVYYNEDPIQYALPVKGVLPDAQRIAFDYEFPPRDANDSVTCCGANFLVRVSSLEAIGGFPTETVAEDAMMSLTLIKHGFITAYINEPLSYGLAAEGIRELLTQYGRWCLGTVQILYTEFGAFTRAKRSVLARLSSLEWGTLWAVFTAAGILYLWLPIFFWFTGVTVFPSMGGAEFLSYFGPSWPLQMIVGPWLCNGLALPVIEEAKSLIGATVIFRATWRGLVRSKNSRFVVTDKGSIRTGVVVHWAILGPILSVGVLTVAGMAYMTFCPYAPFAGSGLGAMKVVQYVFGYYNLAVIAVAAMLCVEPPQRRREQRFAADEPALLQTGDCRADAMVLNISVGGALLEVPNSFPFGSDLTVAIEGVGQLPGRIVRVDDRSLVGVQFETTPAVRAALVRKLFSPRYVRAIKKADIGGVVVALRRRLFT